MELESLRCIVSHMERVVVVRPTYALFSLETQSPREHLDLYSTFVQSRSSIDWEVLLEIIRLEVLNFLQYIISLTFSVGSVRRTFLWIRFSDIFYQFYNYDEIVFLVYVYWLFMVLVIANIRFSRFINELFNFGIKNIVEKPIIDKVSFNIFKFVKEDSLWGGY